MTLFRSWISFLCLGTFLAFCGCSRVPADFPRVVPCVVTITDQGQPVKGAFIQIDTDPPSPSLSVSAKTDENGQAELHTFLGSYSKPGVPVGKLVMAIQKEPAAEHFKTEAERNAMSYDEGIKYDREWKARTAKMPKIIPPALSATQTSPIKKEVTAGQPIQWEVKLEEMR